LGVLLAAGAACGNGTPQVGGTSLEMTVVGPAECAPAQTGRCFEVRVENAGESGDGFCELRIARRDGDSEEILDSRRLDFQDIEGGLTAFLDLDAESVRLLKTDESAYLSTYCEPGPNS
jgi:hypothetical protein